ncbi:MAG: hypothetical protein FWF79_05765 [Defluviitaleaceae bacterium]|nr:hypothetical protein [Defluviitaleaceae bacterium]
MVISHNVPALFTHLSMRRADRGLQQAMTRLSSGSRINSAREDAAGLAIANKLNYQVGGLLRASENATHGISLIQTAEGALNEVHNMLQRMRQLAVQSAHGTYTPEDRAMIQMEIDQLTNEIHSIARNTEFNRMRILNGEANRVVENSVWMVDALGDEPSRDMTRQIVTTLFVSHQVPAGRLNYTILEAGRGAVVPITPQIEPLIDQETNLPLVPEELGFNSDTSITVNGMIFSVRAGESWESLRSHMNDRLQYEGISVHQGVVDPTTGLRTYFLVTNIAGSDQSIAVSGDIEMFGVPSIAAGSDTGTDARVAANTPPTLAGGEPILENGEIPLGGLLDVNGQPVPGAVLAATSHGNKVLIRGSMGEDIRLNIQVQFNAATGEFEFPNGISINELTNQGSPAIGDPADPGYVPATDPGRFINGLHMTKDFRSFGPLMLQIGPSHNTAMAVQIPRLNAETLGLLEYVGGIQRMKLNYRSIAGSTRAINIIDDAITTVSNVRARLGAYQNRLESTVRNLDVSAENTEISRSRIQDTDMARETTRFAQYNVMFQAAMSVLSQANQRPQQILQLMQ